MCTRKELGLLILKQPYTHLSHVRYILILGYILACNTASIFTCFGLRRQLLSLDIHVIATVAAL